MGGETLSPKLRDWTRLCELRSRSPKPLQSPLGRASERAQVVFDGQPDASRIDSVVLVPQGVAQRANVGPRNIRTQFLRQVSKPLGGFTDPFETTLRGVARLEIVQKGVQSIPFVNSRMRMALLRMSSNRWIGSLEGTDRLGVDSPPHSRFQRAFLDQFDGPPKHARDLPLNSDYVEKRQATGTVEGSQQVNVGIRTLFATDG